MVIDALIGHLVGDYIFQNDWMALNKKKRFLPLFIHSVLWAVTVIFFAGWYELNIFLILAITHFIQDGSNIVVKFMHFKGSVKFSEAPMAPWSIIITDNILHILVIYIIFIYR